MSFVSAAAILDQPYDLTVSCEGFTCSSLNITVLNPNSSILVNNKQMTDNTFYANYTLTPTANGEYIFYYTDGTNTSQGLFTTNPLGTDFSLSQAAILVFILAFLFISLGFSIYGINKADKGEWQILYICLSYVLLFSITFLLWVINKNYLYDVPLLERVFWIIWLVLGIMFFPFLIFVSGYILKKEAESLLADDLQKQGYTREEALEMAKKRPR